MVALYSLEFKDEVDRGLFKFAQLVEKCLQNMLVLSSVIYGFKKLNRLKLLLPKYTT